jgi:PAP2 superfamily protein
MTTGPQSRDFAVPSFVGGQGHVEEGQAKHDAQRDEHERRWGPPAVASRTTLAAALVALGATLVVAVSLFGLGLTPDRYLFVLLVPALVLRQPRKYLADFVPFALLLVFYSEFRGIAHLVRPHPWYTPQLRLERFMFDGHLPTLVVQQALGTAPNAVAAHAAVIATQLHFIVPPILAFVLWMRRRALFYRFAITMLVLSFAAAIVFLVYPAAPPWAASDAQLTPTVVHITHSRETLSAGASGVAAPSLTRLIPKNPYAAIPSLHAGYAFFVFLFVTVLAWRTRWRWWIGCGAALYPIVEASAVVYTGDHYVIDTLIGFAFATAVVFGVARLWGRLGLPE